MAERRGFEPPVPCGTPDFESGAIDHSATSPAQERGNVGRIAQNGSRKSPRVCEAKIRAKGGAARCNAGFAEPPCLWRSFRGYSGHARLITFAEKFCAQRHLAPEKYEAAVLRLTLHAPARVLRPVLALVPDYFVADREFVRGVGRIRLLREFEGEAFDYAHDPLNRGWLRRGLRLRVSTRKMRRLVWATLRDEAERKSEP